MCAAVGPWTARSLQMANEQDYLDQLFAIYPVRLNQRRPLSPQVIDGIADAYNRHDAPRLLEILLKQPVFPVKDSYIAYLKLDPNALSRNPRTLKRITGILYEMGLETILENASAPKESNRQIGPLFKDWLKSGSMGCALTTEPGEFLESARDILFVGSDNALSSFAQEYLGYTHEKGLDFLGKFGGKYVMGEAKYLSDFGGHQMAQFNDAISTVIAPLIPGSRAVMKIAILDGVLYIPRRNKMHQGLLHFGQENILLSALLLRDFLYTL